MGDLQGGVWQPLPARRRRLLEAWSRYGPARAPTIWVSVPGRTELGGNHTDHQGGVVAAAAVDRDLVACASPRDDDRVRVVSLGHEPVELSILDLDAVPGDRESTVALVRGALDGLRRRGHHLTGFDAVVHSQIGPGEGLSSSAAFTVLVTFLAELLGDVEPDPVLAAQVAQFAEQTHFGKPCGLMDQLACAVGGAALFDFFDPRHPGIHPVPLPLSQLGYSLVLLDTGSTHHDLTAEYAAIPADMERVAHQLGRTRLVDVDPDILHRRLPDLRRSVGDRAVLRALHFVAETERVRAQGEALADGDLGRFLGLVHASGLSSWTLLQNVTPKTSISQTLTPQTLSSERRVDEQRADEQRADEHRVDEHRVDEQSVALALAVTQRALQQLCATENVGPGVCRVHGGGFAGRIQIFLPSPLVPALGRELAPLFGDGACLETTIRPHGAVFCREDEMG